MFLIISEIYLFLFRTHVTFKVSWRLNKGRRYKSTEKTIHLADDDTGIIR